MYIESVLNATSEFHHIIVLYKGKKQIFLLSFKKIPFNSVIQLLVFLKQQPVETGYS